MPAPVKRTLSGEIDFSAYLREQSVAIATVDQGSLIDISCSFFTLPSFYEWKTGRELLGCEDVRLYISGSDVTSALKAEIQRLISVIPPDVVSKAYLTGANSYIDYVSKFGAYLADFGRDKQFATTYAADPDWAKKFSTLGDRKAGFMGNLHALSFLFRFIPLPPISLQAVWDGFNAKQGKPSSGLAILSPLVVTFSQGPAPSYEAFDPAQFTPAGRLVYQLELSLKNPLEGALKEVSSRLTDISMQLEVIRTKYMDPNLTQIATVAEDLRLGNKTLADGLDTLKKTVDQIKGA